jgi:hypothetical protein
LAKFKVGDKVKISTPDKWPTCTKFTLAGAEATVGSWVDWPEAMDPYSEFIYVMIDKAAGDGKMYEGVNMIFREESLKKITT